MRRAFIYLAGLVFVGVLVIAWVTHGTGVVANDISRNIYIPDELTMPLQVKAAYNGEDIFFRYRWPSARPGIYHDMMRFEDGKWVRYGASVAGPQPQGIYEDRMTMMVDDGGVPEFARYGGYVTIGDRMRFFTDEASRDEVGAHPYLGAVRGLAEVGIFRRRGRTSATGHRWCPSRTWRRYATRATSSTCGTGVPTAATRSAPPTTSSSSRRATATRGAVPSPTTGTVRRSSRCSCSTPTRRA